MPYDHGFIREMTLEESWFEFKGEQNIRCVVYSDHRFSFSFCTPNNNRLYMPFATPIEHDELFTTLFTKFLKDVKHFN